MRNEILDKTNKNSFNVTSNDDDDDDDNWEDVAALKKTEPTYENPVKLISIYNYTYINVVMELTTRFQTLY